MLALLSKKSCLSILEKRLVDDMLTVLLDLPLIVFEQELHTLIVVLMCLAAAYHLIVDALLRVQLLHLRSLVV